MNERTGPPSVAVTFRATDDMREAIEHSLQDLATVVYVQDITGRDRTRALELAAAILAWNPWRELAREELPAMARTPFMQLISAGADQVRFEDLADSMMLASNVGAYAEPMAEHVVAMFLALAKRLTRTTRGLARGEFDQWVRTVPIEGSVCGIVGFGGIGKATARRMRGLGSAIHAVNTTGRTDEPVEFVGTLADLETVLTVSDFVVVAVPLTKETRGLIGRRELELMKPTAILVNVARGAIVEEEALYEHLRTHPEFGAGIDAWWNEPRGQAAFGTRFPFFDLPNLIGSPHNSAMVPGIEVHAVRRAAENVARHLRSEPVTGVVRREDYEG